jgi:hypothetical protein
VVWELQAARVHSMVRLNKPEVKAFGFMEDLPGLINGRAV